MKLYNVVGLDDLEGVVLARCTTPQKAQKAKELCEEQGWEGMLEIVQDEIPIDTVELNGELINL